MRSALHARRRRAETSSGIAIATSASAARSHHNHDGTPVAAVDEPAADDKVVGDSDGVGLGGPVTVGLDTAVVSRVAVGVAVGIVAVGTGVSGRVEFAVVAVVVWVGVGESVRAGDRVGREIVAVGVGVSGPIGDRVAAGMVDVTDRDGVTVGNPGAPSPPHDATSSVATVRPVARITHGSGPASWIPDRVVTSPPFHALDGRA
ncbi:MAG TPA: hypothetical protein VFH02_14065 [Jiangellaceae bacterium]|nr:hypothetical protein [Jiangellaceae bacterium]